MKGILKWPLIVAAVVVVLRVVNERAGGPPALSSALSVVALHTLLVPVYFAIRLARSGAERPYAALLKLILVYAIWTRAMLIPVYWLARVFEWPESRSDGLYGPDVNAIVGFIVIPFVTALFWTRLPAAPPAPDALASPAGAAVSRLHPASVVTARPAARTTAKAALFV